MLLDASWHLICSEELFGFTVVEVSNEHVYRHNLGKPRHVLLHPFSQKLSGLNHFFDRVKIRSHGIDILLPAHNKSGSGVFFQKSAGNFRIIAKKNPLSVVLSSNCRSGAAFAKQNFHPLCDTLRRAAPPRPLSHSWARDNESLIFVLGQRMQSGRWEPPKLTSL